MKRKELLACAALLLAAAIWGFAFVAQRVAINFLPSFFYNGVRFLLGGISMLPLLLFYHPKQNIAKKMTRPALLPGILAGLILFAASSLQQIGLEHTSSGEAGFITSLYIILVPLFGIFWGHRLRFVTLLSAVIAVLGMFLLSAKGGTILSPSNLFILLGAFFWAAQILIIDHYMQKTNMMHLALIQYFVCAFLSLGISLLFERVNPYHISGAMIPILYGGILSVGIAYTLQILGQRYAQPAHSAVMMGMESVFSALGGFLILGENLSMKGYIGCALMLMAILTSQYSLFRRAKKPTNLR
ncbi:MAG TPA: EamA family transporter [Ruminococcaceae bacterium]|nr:EamA family transporter [Oscillospiraceae bacterium]